MLNRLIYILIFSIILASCSGQEARRPLQKHSGSFIKESAERNKELYDHEKDIIEKIIAKDSLHTYFTSEKGF